MANIQITSLPVATTLTGLESVLIVQNGVTSTTTTAAISASPNQQQTFLTVGQQTLLPNSRSLSTGTGLTFADSGAKSSYQISLTGAALSLVNSGNGFQVKTNATTLTSVQIAVGTGLAITSPDGLSGNPTISYSGIMANLAGQTGTGLLSIAGALATPVSIAATANQTTVLNGNAVGGNPTVGLASNAILPGVNSLTLPMGTAAQQLAGGPGQIRFNTDTQNYVGFSNGVWSNFAQSNVGVSTFSGGSTGLTPNTSTIGPITLGGVLAATNGGTGAATLTGYLKGTGITAFTAAATVPTTDLSGLVTNAQLANNSITINGVITALGTSSTLTAVTTAALTIGGGLTGASFNGSTAITIANSGILSLTGTAPVVVGTGQNPAVSVTGSALSVVSDANVTLTAGGTPLTSLLAAASVTAGWTGTLSAARGGTGVATLTGLGYGNGTAAFTAATAAQVVAVIGATAVANATTAVNAVNVGVTASVANATNYLSFTSATTGNLPVLVNSAITVNPSTSSVTSGIQGGTF